MELATKKKLTGVVTFLFFLCGGIEYAIILPSLWPYLDLKFHSTRWFYGICFAAFSVSGLIFSPVFGYWSDRIQIAKPIVIFCNVFEIAGNLVYFSSQSQYMVLVGRLLSGVGTGAGAAIFAMLARSTTVQERTRVFALAMSCRFIGLIVGPGLNAITSTIAPRQLGPFLLDKYTAPGLLMACVWVVIEVLVIFLYFDLPTLPDQSAAQQTLNSEKRPIPTETDPLLGGGDSESGTTRSRHNSTCQSPTVRLEDSVSDATLTTSSLELRSSWPDKLLDMMREEWVVLLACQFILFFNQTALETVIVPLGRELLGWNILATSIFYCGCAIEGIACFMFLRWLSKRVADRWLLLFGIIAELVSLGVYIYYVPTANPSNRTENYIYMITGSFIGIGALSFFSVATTSLLTKFTSNKYQGTSQGVRRSVGFIATIMGPVWAGAFLNRLTFMLAVEAGLVALLLMMVLLSFSKLRFDMPKASPPANS